MCVCERSTLQKIVLWDYSSRLYKKNVKSFGMFIVAVVERHGGGVNVYVSICPPHVFGGV